MNYIQEVGVEGIKQRAVPLNMSNRMKTRNWKNAAVYFRSWRPIVAQYNLQYHVEGLYFLFNFGRKLQREVYYQGVFDIGEYADVGAVLLFTCRTKRIF